jgi:hypothetical membrane protein
MSLRHHHHRRRFDTRRPDQPPRGYAASALCGILAGPVLLVASWTATLAQPNEFSFIDDPPSDLGADTADAPWIANQLASNLAGLLVIAFAIGLSRQLGHHRSARLGASLVGAGGAGLFLTGIFTLDCRQIDTDCSNRDVSWQTSAHLAVGLLTTLALVSAPFVVARAVRFTTTWRHLRIPSLIFATLTIAGAVAGSSIGAGLGAYALVTTWFAWITMLAINMRNKATPAPQPTTNPKHG